MTPISAPLESDAPPAISIPPNAKTAGFREVFPHVRVDLAAKMVEFDAKTSPLLIPDANAPLMFLEAIACMPDTREHESLLVSTARPSHVHAALLLIGLQPGEPGKWKMENDQLVPVDASGPRLNVEFEWADEDAPHERHRIDPLDWVTNTDGRSSLRTMIEGETRARPGWVFAGSIMVKTPHDREIYAADEAGTVMGLATFGGEMIAWSRTISPDAGVDVPEWIADFNPTPPIPKPPSPGTAVIVRISPE